MTKGFIVSRLVVRSSFVIPAMLMLTNCELADKNSLNTGVEARESPPPQLVNLASLVPTARWTDSSAYESPFTVAVDSAGNTVIGGFTEGAVTGSNLGYRDAFLRKFRSDGSIAWTRQFGSSNNNDAVYSIKTDRDGNIYAAGSIGGLSEDSFVMKLDPSGVQQFLATDGGTGYERINSLMLGDAGEFYGFGYTTQDAIHQPAPETGKCTLTKFSATGQKIWAKHFTTPGGLAFYDDSYYCLAAARSVGSGDLYLTFSTKGSYAGVSNRGGFDGVIVRVDADGNIIWSKTIGGPGDDRIYAAEADAAGNLYITGATTSALATRDGSTNLGGSDVFVAKFDAAGNTLWINQLGGSGNDEGTTLTLATDGRLYVAGSTDGILYEMGGNGGRDIFLMRMSLNGGLESYTVTGSTGNENGRSVVLNSDASRAYILGNSDSASYLGYSPQNVGACLLEYKLK